MRMAQGKGRKTQKVGAEVEAHLYERFVNYVESKYGKKRGVLSKELETAMRRHLNSPDDDDILIQISENLADIDEKVNRLNAAVADEADGGTTTAPVKSHTYTQTEQDAYTYEDPEDKRDAPTKPGAKAATQDKVNYLLDTFVAEDGEGEFILPDDVEAHISQHYDFGDRTLRKYRDKLIERLNEEYAVGKHPNNDSILFYAEDEADVRAWIEERE